MYREVGGIWSEASSNLFGRQKKTIVGLTGICVKTRGERVHRIRDFKEYYFNSVPPTSHTCLHVWHEQVYER